MRINLFFACILFFSCSTKQQNPNQAIWDRNQARYDSLMHLIAQRDSLTLSDTSIYGMWIGSNPLIITPQSISFGGKMFDCTRNGDTLTYLNSDNEEVSLLVRNTDNVLSTVQIAAGNEFGYQSYERRDTIIEHLRAELKQVIKDVENGPRINSGTTTAFVCPDCGKEITDGKMYYKVNESIQSFSLGGKSPSDYPSGLVPYPCKNCIKNY